MDQSQKWNKLTVFESEKNAASILVKFAVLLLSPFRWVRWTAQAETGWVINRWWTNMTRVFRERQWGICWPPGLLHTNLCLQLNGGEKELTLPAFWKWPHTSSFTHLMDWPTYQSLKHVFSMKPLDDALT